MDKETLHGQLKSRYKREEWKSILTSIFPKRDFFQIVKDIPLETQPQQSLAKGIVQFGSITLDDGNQLALYEVELKPLATNIGRNRVGLRNLVHANLTPGIVDGALVSYHQEGIDEWRFAFLSKSFYWDDEGQVMKQETHPKRYTYVLGPDETCVTPRDRFHYLIEKRTKTLKDVLEAFSVEKVNREFFSKYKRHYQAFVDDLMGYGFRKNVFGSEDKAVRDFVKKMLGRIVFLYFVQKKGWLDVKEGADYGEGDKQFLQSLFKKHDNDTFYSTCLVPLFFEALNDPNNRIYSVTGNRFPFLNGGLFERDETERKPKADFITFNASLFQDLFDFFGEYNFTIDESTPDDLDIGIDPEMLGHIFENLLEDNRDKGAFYTPKMIVQYMSQECLIQYLEAHLGENKAIERFIRYNDRGADEDKDNFIRANGSKIEKLLRDVRICDPAIGSGAFPMGIMQEIYHAQLALDWTIEDKGKIKRDIIQHSIYGVDKDKGAVDIARLRFWLSLIVDQEVKPGEEPQTLPSFDYKIMQGDSLFESFRGHSLKHEKAQKDGQQAMSFDDISVYDSIDDELVRLEKEFYKPKNSHRKEEIRKKIDELIAKAVESALKEDIKRQQASLRTSKKAISADGKRVRQQKKEIAAIEARIEDLELSVNEIRPYLKKDEKPYFLWHRYFKEIFDQGGFDIVIGNPPYIRQESITDIKPYLKETDGQPNYEVYNSTSDIYTYFFELGHKILKPHTGVFSFICSKKYTRARYGQNLRRYLLQNTELTGYVDFDEVQVFGATVDTSIIFFRSEAQPAANYTFAHCVVGNDLQKNDALHEYLNKNGVLYDRRFLNEDSWAFADPDAERIKEKLEILGKRLDSWDVEILRGILTGFNQAFYIDEKKRDSFVRDEPNLESIIRPILRGRDIDRYAINHSGSFLINTHNGYTNQGGDKVLAVDVRNDYPKLFQYLSSYEKELSKRADKGSHWSNLRNCAFLERFDEPKLVWITLTDKPKFVIDCDKFLTNDSTFFMVGSDLKYLCAILNSRLSEWYFDMITTSSGVGTNMWKKTYVEQIPIPEIPKEDMRPFEVLVDYITFIKKYEPQISSYTPNSHMAANYEELVDACVYELYFKEHMQEQGITVLKEVTELLKPIDGIDDKTKAEVISTVYDAYKSPDNTIRRRIMDFPAKSADIISVIQNG